tara:strand:- start:733 stop:1215 length:483 start_codon:yes stop_codon:yes gene_type:complete
MILLDVYVVFHMLDEDWYSRLITRITKTPINHCGIMVRPEGGDAVYYLTTVDKPWREVNAASYFRLSPPHRIFYAGSTYHQSSKIMNLEQEYIIRPWQIILWNFVTRYVFPFWKPKSCVRFTVKTLKSMGFVIEDHTLPLKLLKELDNADYYVEWKGKSR